MSAVVAIWTLIMTSGILRQEYHIETSIRAAGGAHRLIMLQIAYGTQIHQLRMSRKANAEINWKFTDNAVNQGMKLFRTALAVAAFME